MMFGGLEILIIVPMVAAVLVLLPGSQRWARQAGVAAGTVTFVAAAALVPSVVDDPYTFTWQSDARWIESLDVRWRLGVDQLSLPLVLLTALLGWCCLVALMKRAPDCGGTNRLVALVLVIEAGSIGTFLALDLVVFFIFFELVLIPMWFVIAAWGDSHDPAGRRAAATRFLVVTVTGSALMLVGFLLLRQKTGTFDLEQLSARMGAGVGHTTQVTVAVLFLLGFGAKVPVWPLHFWLPDAHSKAPTVGSVLLAGVLLKLGSYGLLRFWYDVVPEGASTVAPYLGALGVVGIIYGSLACLAQRDLKRLIAYSSIGHMGFVLLAASAMTRQGQLAANFANVAHGVITGLLFFLVGAVKDRAGTTRFDLLGRGLYGRAPRLAGLFAVAAMASLGLPGLAGFWGEMLAMLSAFSPADALQRSTYLTLMALAGVGAVLTAVYFVVAVRRLSQGPTAGDALPDVHGDEWVAWSPLVVLTVALGLFPGLLLWPAGSIPQALLAGVGG